MALPLEGVKVLDFTAIMAGPYCTLMLADMGAEVTKIEAFPDGDGSRRFDPKVNGESYCFAVLNRNKRSLALDMKSAQGKEIFLSLARSADIVIENYRPGVMRSFGLDYTALAKDHPGLIFVSISGYGQTGPDSGKGGFDLVAQGVSGLMSITGHPGGPPVKVGVPLTDLGAGLFALSAILAALYYRTRSGCGQHIDTSLVEAGVALSVWEASEYFAGRGVPQPMGSAHRMSAPYQAIRCADGYMTLAAANDRLFQRLCELLGHPEWAADPEYADDTRRVHNRAALASLIESITIEQARSHWLALFEANGLPCGPINTYDQVFADPHIRARGMVVETDHPTLGRIRTLGSPLKMSATPPIVGRPAPLLGEHTREVLREIGYTEEEISQFAG